MVCLGRKMKVELKTCSVCDPPGSTPAPYAGGVVGGMSFLWQVSLDLFWVCQW